MQVAQYCTKCKEVQPHKDLNKYLVCRECGKKKRYETNNKSR